MNPSQAIGRLYKGEWHGGMQPLGYMPLKVMLVMRIRLLGGKGMLSHTVGWLFVGSASFNTLPRNFRLGSRRKCAIRSSNARTRLIWLFREILPSSFWPPWLMSAPRTAIAFPFPAALSFSVLDRGARTWTRSLTERLTAMTPYCPLAKRRNDLYCISKRMIWEHKNPYTPVQ